MGYDDGLRPSSVLFVCTMNAVRSPMASAMLQHLLGTNVHVQSAGVRPGHADPFVVAVMDEIGIDLSDFEPQALSEVAQQHFDVIISLSPEAHHHAIELTRVMSADVHYWPTQDITLLCEGASRLERLTHYRSLRETLFQRVKQEFVLLGGPVV